MALPSSDPSNLSASAGNQDLVRQLAEWNATKNTYPKDKHITALISETAIQFPHKTAIQFEDRELSYEQLDKLSNRLANYLLHQGILPEDIIGLTITRSPELIIAMLAVMKTGAAYLPLDPLYPKNRIEFMLADSNARLLITSGPNKHQLDTSTSELTIEDILSLLGSYADQCPAIAMNGSGLAYVLYTSGSTGKPKGVQIEHHSLLNFLLSMQRTPGITTSDKLLAVTTISFDIAGLEIYLPLISGATIVLANAATCRDGRRLLEMIEEHRITVMQATPYTWRMLLDAGWTKKYPLKVLCGGEAFPKEYGERLLEKCQSLWNLYGPTETTIWSSVKQITEKDSLITIGRPIDNTQFFILDEFNNLAPPGIEGEICIAGDGLARGYINRFELTKERFVNIPYAEWPGAIMYRTGDLGKVLSNGEILCLGRIDNQVKIRGFRIEISEIEHALTSQPGIKDAAVATWEDLSGNQRLVAYLVLYPDQHTTPPDTDGNSTLPHEVFQSWTSQLKKELPHFMIPTEFVILASMPVTANGKIDRKNLPRPAIRTQLIDNTFIAPRTVAERLVAAIWSEQLKVPDISINSNFFQLGGHSLIAVNIMTAIEQQTGRRLPLASIFENATIEQLALLIDRKEDEIKWDSLVPIRKTGTKTPIYLVHGSGLNVLAFSALGKYMDEDQPVYAMQALGLNGKTEFLYSIEEIARKYNAELLVHDPHGPYALAGYSLGGFIAFEMARQLLQMGKEVKMLGILDTNAGNRDPSEKKNKRIYKTIIRQFKKLFFFSKLFLTHPQRTAAYQFDILNERFRKLFYRKYKVDKEFFTYEQELNRSYNIAYDSYFMKPIDLTIDLFKVQKRIYYVDDPLYMEWKRYTTKDVGIQVVPGDHKTFLLPPNDKEFARLLQARLDQRTRS
jgi:amino acid adenylation domain-containing protein